MTLDAELGLAKSSSTKLIMKTVVSIIVAGIVILVLVSCISRGSMDRVSLMMALANHDQLLIQSIAKEKSVQQIDLRKEFLLPASSGRALQSNQYFIEVWNKEKGKIAWIYYEFVDEKIRRLGYKCIDGEFREMLSEWVHNKDVHIEQKNSKYTIFDGREFK